MREVKVKSVVPVYLVGLVWLLCSTVLPMYRWYDWVIASIAALLVYRAANKIFRPKTILIEEEPEPINTGNKELDEVLTTGTAYMAELNTLNMNIPNENINKKIDEMMRIGRNIFEFITKNPTEVRQIRKFMNYYLPTTINLLKEYEEFRRQGTKSESVLEAMKKIEGVLDTIVVAFNKTLDDLYKNKVLNISVDIEVLEKMIKEENL